MNVQLAAALLVMAGCSVQSMAWHVDSNTTVADLDARYAEELADLERSNACEVGDPATGGGYVSSVTECLEYHRIWRRYHQARREVESR